MDTSLTQRRRELFPASDDSSSDDLGHIGPLSDSELSDVPSSTVSNDLDCSIKSLSGHLISDYVILENINENDDKRKDHNPDSSPNEKGSKDDTPSRKSPNFTLKTPQDAVSITSDLPKLVRKSPFKTSSTKLESGKRKLPFSSSPIENKHIKLDQASKVRTALFPKSDNEMTVPTKSFYSNKSQTVVYNYVNKENTMHIRSKFSSPAVRLRRRNLRKRRYGQINAGVSHSIRKPKQKQISRAQLLQAALNIMDNSPLNSFLDNLQGITNTRNVAEKQKEVPVVDYNISNEVLEQELDVVTSESRKRELSPPPDPNKKFFKFKRSNATITVEKHMKLKVDDGKFQLVEGKRHNAKRFKSRHINFDTTDLTVPDDNVLISSDKIDNILCSLEDDCNKENERSPQSFAEVPSSEQMILHAYNSVSMSENSIHLHSNIITGPNSTQESMLLSPTSLMCNMTSGLALNSPKKQRSLFNTEEVVNKVGSMDKLFPIFYEPNTTTLNTLKPTKIGSNCKKAKPLPKGQMFLDAGQKKFGATVCPECNFMYHMGDPSEELIHLNYHSSGSVLRFGGWKEERVVSTLVNARIIRVFPSDPKPWLNKVKELLDVINRDLGYYEMPVDLTNTQIFLYIKNKTIIGCLVAEIKTTAYRLLNQDFEVDFCSEISYPVKCGVSRIWVVNNHRKEGVATSLLNSLRANFMFGGILAKEDIAFSSPTEMGKAFATKYFNTPNFLVYTS